MSTSSAESIPLQPDPGTGRRHSLIPPQDQVQIHRATSPAQGSTSTTSTAVHVDYFDRAEPTWVVNRYGRTVKLKPPFIDSKLKPITTSFADRCGSLLEHPIDFFDHIFSYEPKNWTRLVHPEVSPPDLLLDAHLLRFMTKGALYWVYNHRYDGRVMVLKHRSSSTDV